MAKKNIPIPSMEDFNLKSFKKLKGGGLAIEFNYMFSCAGAAHTYEGKPTVTLEMHDDLLRLLEKQKTSIISIDGIKYRMIPETLERLIVDHEADLKKLFQITEGLTSEAMERIDVTGMSISGTGEKKKVCIKYTWTDENKKIIGRSTSAILISGNKLGFEEDLEEDLNTIKNEIYQYLYGSKHGDSEQAEIDFEAREEAEE